MSHEISFSRQPSQQTISSYFTFQIKNRDGKDLKCSTQHGMYATDFLQGHTTYSPSMVLELWFCGPDGQVPVEMSHNMPMYSLEHLYTSIKPAQAISQEKSNFYLFENLYNRVLLPLLLNGHVSIRKCAHD